MLVTFTSRAYSDITLFGDIATQLLNMMGHTGTVPGSILAEDIPAALARLRAGLEADKRAGAEPPTAHAEDLDDEAEEDEEDEAPVALARRAWPLLQLLEASARQQVDVMWKESG